MKKCKKIEVFAGAREKKKRKKEYFWQYHWQNDEKNVSLYLERLEMKDYRLERHPAPTYNL